MKILSIETSCDETAVSVVECSGELNSPKFEVLGNALFSQINIHKEFGGVYPTLAKREHAKNLTPLLKEALTQANLFFTKSKKEENAKAWSVIEKILEKEGVLFENFKKDFVSVEKPNVDIISVTIGPGLAPALWVGICFAQALGALWKIPVFGVNHMEGHIASVLKQENDRRPVEFPALALLISGGHTELVEINDWCDYKVIGETVDDAVGEAFDKTARMLGLSYPGGPEISKLSKEAIIQNLPRIARLPRPMIHSKNLNFSFSGLKTAVLYYIRDNFEGNNTNMALKDKADLAREFEDSIVEVLTNKTRLAIDVTGAKTLIIAGGVINDERIRNEFLKFEAIYKDLLVKIPEKSLTTDNSVMIAMATYLNIKRYPEILKDISPMKALGNLRLGTK